MQTLAAGAAVPGTSVALLAPGQAGGEEFLAAPLGEALPGWRLALRLEGDDPFGRAAGQRVAAYLWASMLSVGAIVLIALAAGSYLLRQARLARLKNDFIATVTHELKTPLASVRLFAETLREGRYEDDAQAARYLDLLVRENERLSRLIDNFLSFSRMERNKQALEFAPARPADLMETAAEAVRQRFESGGCSFTVEVAPDLPDVDADADAMVTVLLNLLDNAWKYSGEEKRIALRARAEGGGRLLRGRGQRHRHDAAAGAAGLRAVLPGGQPPLAQRRRLRPGAEHREVHRGRARRQRRRAQRAGQGQHVHRPAADVFLALIRGRDAPG